jgi:hypothetical protein
LPPGVIAASETTKADLEQRLRSVENSASVAKVLGVIGLTVLALAGAGIAHLLQRFGELTEAKSQHASDVARLEKAIDKLEGRIGQLRAEANSGRMVLASVTSGYCREYAGKIERVGPNSITLGTCLAGLYSSLYST